MRAGSQTIATNKRVSRAVIALSTLCVLLSATGCRLCCDHEDVAFNAYGGRWERTDRNSGRVGSLFDPAGATAQDASPRESVDQGRNQRSSIAPEDADLLPSTDPNQAPESNLPPRKTEEETEKQFQERLERFEKDKQKLLSAGVIPGEPLPPAIR